MSFFISFFSEKSEVKGLISCSLPGYQYIFVYFSFVYCIQYYLYIVLLYILVCIFQVNFLRFGFGLLRFPHFLDITKCLRMPTLFQILRTIQQTIETSVDNFNAKCITYVLLNVQTFIQVQSQVSQTNYHLFWEKKLKELFSLVQYYQILTKSPPLIFSFRD